MSGGSRYMPALARAAGESAAVPKADPFTGAARYLPAGTAGSV